VCETIESSDLVINIGPLLSDSNTGGFTRNIPDTKLAILAHDHCQIAGKKFEGMHFLPVLKHIVDELAANSSKYNLPRTQSWKKLEVF
jgi:pyruvate decarboxylase